jgi:MarR family transcriptional regulator, lower aerobic nicotinate degradation pathway regulator
MNDAMTPSSARKTTPSTNKGGRKKGVPASQQDVSLDHVIYDKPGFLARRLQQIGVSIFLEETKDFDITPLQYGVMAAVRASPGVDQIGVSSKVGLDRTTVVGIVDRLERKGLMARRADPSDRRVRQLFLTQAGQQRLIDMRAATDRVQKRLLEPLGERESAKFVACLKRIIEHHNEDSRVPISDPTLRATITGVGVDGEARAT